MTVETLGPEDLFIEVDPQTLRGLLDEWRWKVGDDAQVFRVTVFGDLFTEDAGGRVHWLDTGSGDYVEIAETRDRWHEAVEIHGEELFHWNTLGELRARGAKLRKGSVYSWRQAPMLGGSESADNVDFISLSVHVSHAGRLARALRDVPPGTKIDSVEFVIGLRGGGPAAEGAEAIYQVVINEELQYSIWPAGEEVPTGWKSAGKTGTKTQCLDYIAEVWTDLRPLSLRQDEEGTEK